MAEGKPPASGNTPFEQTLAALTASPVLPAMAVLDADHVLWPSTCQHLGEDMPLHADAPAVLSALHARGVRLAVVACPSSLPGGVQGEGVSGTESHVKAAAGVPSLGTTVKATLDRAGLSAMIDVLHVLEVDPKQQSLAALQAQSEVHWRELRAATGVPWSSCLALVGSASNLRAANRAGAASVLVRQGLDPACISTGLEVWAAKMEGDRGF